MLRLREDNSFVVAGAFWSRFPSSAVEISIDEPPFLWVREHGTLHVPDVHAAQRIPNGGCRLPAFVASLIVPLRLRGEFIGNLNARRTEVRPFTPAQIKLLETFADQAVIAIENVRLFQGAAK